MSLLDDDDLALLAHGFDAALRQHPDDHAALAALYDLGWREALAVAPAAAVATAFTALGATGSAAALLDDVVIRALGLDPAGDLAVALSAPGESFPPGRRHDDRITVDGLASGRLWQAATVLVPVGPMPEIDLVSVDPGSLTGESSGLDPGHAFHRVRADLDPASVTMVRSSAPWEAAVAAARVALAHQLLGAARTVLAQARTHALDRVQFGRPVASFQAVRHRLAEALVSIEGAAAVTAAAGDVVDPLLAALAKSLAGRAGLVAATHAQQVLAGMGFTTEHPFHLWLKRILVLDSVLGSSTRLPVEIGMELMRRGAAPRLVDL
jgi:hypothetical protein